MYSTNWNIHRKDYIIMSRIAESELFQNVFQQEHIISLLGVLKLSDEEAYTHSINVAKYVDKYLTILNEWGEQTYSKDEQEQILVGAFLHDIGKAFLPFGLQHSTKSLSENKRSIIRMHPLLGIVAIENCKMSDIVQNIIYLHHENADGSGYPSKESIEHIRIGYCEDDVPDYVWIVSYADRFDAMTTHRAFKTALNYKEAWQEILKLSETNKLPYRFRRVFYEVIKRESIIPLT